MLSSANDNIRCQYVCQSSNKFYTSAKFSRNGYFIERLSNDCEAINNLNCNIIESKLFDSHLKCTVFNENQSPNRSFGRHMIKFDSLTSCEAKHRLYSTIISDIKQLSKRLITVCNAKLAYSIDLEKGLPTILQTADENTKPQLLHIDVDPSKHHEEHLLVLMALQNDTMIRVVRGSHDYDVLSMKLYETPSIITLAQGEFIIMHPKLIHSGWTAMAENIRLHFYLGLANTQNDDVDNTTYFLNKFDMKRFYSQAFTNRISSLKVSSYKKKILNNRIKASRLLKQKARKPF